MSITSIYRDWSYPPSLVRIVSTNTLSQVGTTGYVLAQADNIAALNNGAFDWLASDMVLVQASNGWGFFTISSDFESLNAFVFVPGVTLPTVIGNVAKFDSIGGNLADTGIAATDLALLSGLTSGKIWVGSAGNVATAVTPTGDVTINNLGVTAIAAGVIVNADINAAAAIDFSKLAALTSGHILVGSAGNVATSVAMSGDATIIASGALTIANDAITTAKILNANVTLAKLASGITPSHIIKFAGKPTTVGGAASEAFTVTGALAASDYAFVQMVDNGTNNVSILQAVVTNDTLTITFSGDPGNDAIFNYQIIRAAS